MTGAEFPRLRWVQDESGNSKGVSAHAVRTTRTFLFGGCRSGEILKVRRDEADTGGRGAAAGRL